jgi:hypothetical protein
MWDYSGNFGVVTKDPTKHDGKATLDETTMRALGLQMPAGQ